MMAIGELQRDALTEIFNMAIGRAAVALGRLAGEEVRLTVPEIGFYSPREAAARLEGSREKRVCGVFQNYHAPFEARAILMFPEEQSLEIVRLMVGESYSLDELTELEQEALAEIGNIILNACIGTITNLTRVSCDMSLPQVQVGIEELLLDFGNIPESDSVLLVYIDFSLSAHTLHGYLAFLMNLPSIKTLMDGVDRFIADNG